MLLTPVDGFVLTVPKGITVPLAVRVADGTLIFSMTGEAAQAVAALISVQNRNKSVL